MANPHKVIAQIIAHAWADPGWHGKLTAAGDDRKQINAVLREKDLELPEMSDLPEGCKIQFVANTDKIRYIVIPTRPKLTDEDVGLFVRFRQLETWTCDCFGGGTDLVNQIKSLFLGKKTAD